MKIKKIYIYITVLLFAGYFYFSYNSSNEKKAYVSAINNILTDIRREDYFAIHSKLDSNLKNKISIEDIQHYCKSIKLNKNLKFDLVNIKKLDNNKVKLSGVVTTNNKKLELYTTLKNSQNRLTLISQKLGKEELKAKKTSFPITKEESVKTPKAAN